jgi:hypothetical protein
MIRVCLGFTDVSDTVASQIRAERAAAGGKDQEPGR